MTKITKHTGGLKEFGHLSDEELKDTKYTKEFKKSYRKHLGRGKSSPVHKIKRFKERLSHGHKTKKYHPKAEIKKNKFDYKRFILALILMCLVAGSIIYFSFYRLDSKFLENKTSLDEEESSGISFEEFMTNSSKFNNKLVSLKGYLYNKLEGTSAAGYYIELLVDDFGNEIQLKKLGEYRDLFKRGRKSAEIYEVKGLFKIGYNFNYIEVNEINEIGKPTKKVKKVVVSEKKTCSDGTIYGECSKNKPLFCFQGELIDKAFECGCDGDELVQNELCMPQYEYGPRRRLLKYIGGSIDINVYKGLNDYLKGLDRTIWSYGPVSDRDFIIVKLDDPIQKKYLDPIVDEIKNKTSDKIKQAKIAIRIVQNIPYDWRGVRDYAIYGKYPYEVVYTNSGVCSEKANILVYLLRGLGYGTAILRFDNENHDAVGIKCFDQYDFKDSGYCFVESTRPTDIGYYQGNYVGVGKLSTHRVIEISDGDSYKNI